MNEEEITQRLMQAVMSLRHLFRREPIAGLKRSEFGVLMMIHHHGAGQGMKVSEISAHLQVTSSSVTQMVTALEAQGLVSRRMDSTDRRSVRVSLTELGNEAVQQAQKHLSDSFAEIAREMGQDKLLQLADLIQEVGAIAARRSAEAGRESEPDDAQVLARHPFLRERWMTPPRESPPPAPEKPPQNLEH